MHRLSFLQCFSEVFPTRHDHLPASFTVASHPTRGLPVGGRSRHVFPSVSIYDTTTFGRVSRSPAIRREVFRSTAALAMLFRTFLHLTGHNDLSNGSVCGTIRQRSGEHSGHRPSDARSSGRRPHSPSSSEHVGIRHDYLPARFTVASRPTRGLPVDGRSRQAVPDISIYDTTAFRRVAGTVSPRGLLEPYGQARGFFGEPHSRPPSPLQCRIDTISGSFLSAIENWSEACHENCAAPTGLIICRRMWNYGLRHIRLAWANVRYIPYINPM